MEPQLVITLDIPRSPEEAEFLVDCALDHALESLRNNGLLPRGSLLSEDMLTLVVHKGKRLIGALSSLTGIDTSAPGEAGLRTEIDVRYFHPKWHNRKYTTRLFEVLIDASPHPLFLRAPLSDIEREAADELGINYSVESPADMKTITDMFLGNIPCTEKEESPCPGCIRSTLRKHFTTQCARMTVKAHRYQGKTP